MSQILRKLIMLFPLLAMACNSELSIFVAPTTNEEFTITAGTSLVSTSTFELEWSESKDTKNFDVIIASDKECSKVIFEKNNIKDNKTELDALADGNYYVCVFARKQGQRLAAANNGMQITLDRNAPVPTAPSDVTAHHRPFTPKIGVDDLTEVSWAWSQLNGKGTVKFDTANPAACKVSADKDGLYKIKVTFTDKAGHTSEQAYQFYWNGEEMSPTDLEILSFLKTGDALDGFISNSEKSNSSAIWTVTAVDVKTYAYTAPMLDANDTILCDEQQTYSEKTAAAASALSADGRYILCVSVTDRTGLTAYGKSEAVIRDTVAPASATLTLANAAADTYINNVEKLLVSSLFSFSSASENSAVYSLPQAAAVSCDNSLVYDQSLIAGPSDLSADQAYVVCAKVSDPAGNSAYFKSDTVTRDIAAPAAVAFTLANEVADTKISGPDSASSLALATLAAGAYASASFSAPIWDATGLAICSATQTYNLSAVPAISSVTNDGSYALCARIVDEAGNPAYVKSGVFARDALGPTINGFYVVGVALDGYITNAEKNNAGVVWFISTELGATLSYTVGLDNSGNALVCDGSQTYNQSSIPTVASLTPDGPYSACVRATDAAGNISYGKAGNVVRDTAGPAVTINSLNSADPSPALSGTIAETTASIVLTVNGQNYGATNNGDGTWSLADNTLPPLANRTYELVAVATDALGNTASDSSSNELTINAPQFITSWKSDNLDGAADSTSVTLPLLSTGSYNFVVEWGDGTEDLITAWNAAEKTHDYGSAGTRTIKISGQFKGFRLEGSAQAKKLLTISQWGPFNPGNGARAFRYASNLTISATDSPDFTGVADLSYMFGECSALTAVPNIGTWDMSGITSIQGMFTLTPFNSDIGAWDVSSVIDMQSVFLDASAFNQNINSWNVGNVTDFGRMFEGSPFNQPLSGWNTSKSESFYGMFADSPFNQNINNWDTAAVRTLEHMFHDNLVFNQPLGNWNTANVENMADTFNNAKAFNQNINTWNVSKVWTMRFMFNDADAFNQPLNNWVTTSLWQLWQTFGHADNFNQDISSWDVSNVNSMAHMFEQADAFNQPLNSWDTSSVTSMDYMFWGADSFNQAIGSWDVSSVQNFSGMFGWAQAFNQPLNTWNTASANNMEAMFYNADSFNQPLSTFDTSEVTRMDSMFHDMDWNHDISNWDVSKVENFNEMFRSNHTFNQAIGSWNTISATDMGLMFAGATNFNQPLAAWNTSNVTTMVAMFEYMNFNQPIGTWNVSKVTNFYHMFGDNFSFNQDIGDWDTSAATIMTYMFCSARAFNQDISDWDVSNVTSFASMFQYTWDFNQPLNAWDVSSGVQFNDMFYEADAFNQNLNSWNVGNATRMDSMFHNGVFNGNISSWNVSNVQNFNEMFAYSPFAGNLASWNVSSATDMGTMFRDSDVNFDASSWDVSNVTDMSFMFAGTPFNGNVSTWDTGNVTTMRGMFRWSQFNSTISGWDVRNVTTFREMFGDSPFNQPIGAWQTDSAVAMDFMFYWNTVFNQALNNWNVSNVTNMQEMFRDAQSFNQPLNSWDVSKVTNFHGTFWGAYVFNQDLSSWNTTAATTMHGMFGYTTAFNGNIDNWDVADVTNFSSMFFNAQAFNRNLNSWNTSSATNMNAMFEDADLFNGQIGNWDTSDVTNTAYMFKNAPLFNQPIGSWNTGSVTTFEEMFENAKAFNQPIDTWNTAQVTTFKRMFWDADAFDQPLNSWNTSNVIDLTGMFFSTNDFNQPLSNWDVSKVVWMNQTFNWSEEFDQDLSNWDLPLCASFGHVFSDTVMSPANMSNFLIGLAATTQQNNVLVEAWYRSNDASGDAAKASLQARGWTIDY